MLKAVLKWFRGSTVAKLERQLAAARLALFNSQQEVRNLSKQIVELKEHKNFVGALHREVYEAKVLNKIGYANLGNNESAEFKLGIQFTLRHLEQEVVAG